MLGCPYHGTPGPAACRSASPSTGEARDPSGPRHPASPADDRPQQHRRQDSFREQARRPHRRRTVPGHPRRTRPRLRGAPRRRSRPIGPAPGHRRRRRGADPLGHQDRRRGPGSSQEPEGRRARRRGSGQRRRARRREGRRHGRQRPDLQHHLRCRARRRPAARLRAQHRSGQRSTEERGVEAQQVRRCRAAREEGRHRRVRPHRPAGRRAAQGLRRRGPRVRPLRLRAASRTAAWSPSTSCSPRATSSRSTCRRPPRPSASSAPRR